jgi:hypothetical protein
MNTPNHTWGDSPIHEQIRNMNTRPTPESDKAKIAFTSLFANDDAYWIPYVVGIKLERERDEARGQLAGIEDKMRVELGGHPNSKLWGEAGLIAATMRCVDALDVVTAQRDRLAKACDQYSEDEFLCKLHKVTEQRDMLAEALRELCIVLLTDKSPDITDLLNKAGAAMAAVNYSTAKKSQP